MRFFDRLRRITAAAVSVLFLGSCAAPGAVKQTSSDTSSNIDIEGKSQIYYFDVGQGDSEFIQLSDGKNVLIDTGTPDCADELVRRLQKLGVKKLDAVIGTHPHADHIGSMAKIIDSFEIGEVYLPRLPKSQTPTTATYTKLLEAISKKGCRVTQAKAGVEVLKEGSISMEMLAPNSESYEEINNYSAVCMLQIGEKKFLFTGDAQKESEKEMLDSGRDLKADVLKVGHHGSSTSTTANFYEAVSPNIAVISCGKDNSYGLPKESVLKRLSSGNTEIYRTDTSGTIRASTDGTNIQIETLPDF